MKPSMQMISFWFGGVMVVVVLVLAIAILTTDFLSERLYGNKRTIFVVTMFAYAAYRSYRMYHFLKQERHNDDV